MRPPVEPEGAGSFAGEVRLDSGVLVRSLFIRDGLVRSAVHALKYHGADRIARVLAQPLAALLPADASGLVPVPRSLARRIRFGVDPGAGTGPGDGEVGRIAGGRRAAHPRPPS